jgi:hypothetical protein
MILTTYWKKTLQIWIPGFQLPLILLINMGGQVNPGTKKYRSRDANVSEFHTAFPNAPDLL